MTRIIPPWLLTAIATSATFGIASGASAATSATILPQTLVSVASAASAPCTLSLSPQTFSGRGTSVGISAKSSAILGGAPSALERIRLQQAVAVAIPPPTFESSLSVPGTPDPLISKMCGVSFIARAQPLVSSALKATGGLGENDFLASKRLSIRRTSFDADWSRVRAQKLSANEARKLVGSGVMPGDGNTLASVNSWVNQHIRYRDDRDLYGRSDHWASIRTTLKRRAGDCEDIAIAKMQILAALGIPRDAMFLTVARDLVRNADHAVLIVKIDERFLLLDNSTDAVLDGSASHDYRPIYTFGTQGKWLHGYSHS